MSKYIMCNSILAKNSLYIPKISLGIYSLEELCYYIYNNSFDLDESIFNDDLIVWIEKELNLKTLARKLLYLRNEGSGFYKMINLIVSSVNYLKPSEILNLKTMIERLAICDDVEKSKLRGDHYFKLKQYTKSLNEYKKVFNSLDIAKHNEIYISNIYYNIALCHMYMYRFQNAYKNFKIAYEKNPDDKNRDACLNTLYLMYYDEGSLIDMVVKEGFNISKLASIENNLKSAFSNAGNSDSYSLRQAVEITALAIE